MSATLFRGAQTVVTMDDTRRELAGADILLQDGVIADVGGGLAAPEGAQVVDVSGCVVTPDW